MCRTASVVESGKYINISSNLSCLRFWNNHRSNAGTSFIDEGSLKKAALRAFIPSVNMEDHEKYFLPHRN